MIRVTIACRYRRHVGGGGIHAVIIPVVIMNGVLVTVELLRVLVLLLLLLLHAVTVWVLRILVRILGLLVLLMLGEWGVVVRVRGSRPACDGQRSQ